MEWKQIINGLRNYKLFAIRLAEQQARVIKFIPGTYQREREDFGIRVVERIIIQQVSKVADIYSIRKITCLYNTPEEKKVYEPKADMWMASYNLSIKQLQELDGKRSCAFIPEGSYMLLGNTKFVKIRASKCTEF